MGHHSLSHIQVIMSQIECDNIMLVYWEEILAIATSLERERERKKESWRESGISASKVTSLTLLSLLLSVALVLLQSLL